MTQLKRRIFPVTTALIIFITLLICHPSKALAEKRYFEMTIDEATLEVHPQLTYTVFGFNGQVPGPLIHVKEGDDVTIKVTNLTSFPHTVHWHGIYNTWQNDGVPNVTQPEIKPGDSFTYNFIADPTGSLWYHCHVSVNEHVAYRGMWGPLIVDPIKPAKIIKKLKPNKEFIMMFSSYASSWAEKPGFGGLPDDVPDYFAMNGRAFPNTQPIRAEAGDVLRLRLYGAGGETHSLHTHGHHFTVTHKDGFPLPSPYQADTISVAPGERYDIVLEANNPGRFIIHDHVDVHVTNKGKYPGGPITIIEYEDIQRDDDWYAWKDKVYDNNFFYQESIKKGFGLFNHDGHKGKPIEKKRRKRKKRVKSGAK
jgi:FtsP/CotA-like multicopper oxidase with cupredoxin domain